jgi:hypothetical protein
MSEQTILTEVERQKKYLDQLPANFTFPLFNSRKALESQRQSGYRNTAAAAREIIDNAIEAQASRVHVIFNRPHERKPGDRRNRVTGIAFIDDGSGMLPQMARYALSWGGGTHFDDHDFIGKFGFGLPNASINQARRVEVYTRTNASTGFTRAYLDLDEYMGEGSTQEIKPVTTAELPTFVKEYLDRQKWELTHGTVVVWSNPDRLTYKTDASLKEHMLDDFGVTYRYLLKNFELVVEGRKVERVDPLFLDPHARFYRRPEEGGAELVHDEAIPVKFVEDASSGERHLRKVEKPEDLDDSTMVAAGSIHVRVVRFPLGLVVGRETEGIEPVDEMAKKRFEIRKSRRGMSFVRAGREIETVDAFPRRESDKSSGLGDWPLLQAYAYHWAVEVSCTPSLDAVFGITNDKQTVRPTEDFWRLLHDEEIDDLLNREQTWQSEQRTKKAKEARTSGIESRDPSKPSPAEIAAQSADIAVGETPSVPEDKKADANLNFEKTAQEAAKASDQSVEEARKALADRAKIRPYEVTYIDDLHGPFYTPKWVGKQVVVQVNKQHPFFTTLYSAILTVEGGAKAKEAIDLLLITLGREELRTKNPQTADFYVDQRVQRWSPYLASALRNLERQFPEVDEEAA